MKHLGDITKLSGYDLPVVDIITGGSPCQDLSVAGKRAGLQGERSGLFMEQIRIIKEMREHDKADGRTGVAVRPRYMVWENVPGAFSSNGGEDFRAVLEETARIADNSANVPRPPEWRNAGVIVGDGWSIAWRVHDAQFWGVPQRRKRIALVADFGGLTAPEILFERKGLSGDFEPGRETGEGTAGAVGAGVEASSRAISFQERAGKPGGGKGILIQNERVGALSTLNNQSVCCLNDQGGQQMNVSENVTGSLRAEEHGHQPIVYGISAYESNAMKSRNPNSGIYEAETARTLDLNGGSPACNQGGMAVVCVADHVTPKIDKEERAFTLDGRDYKGAQVVCIEGNGSRPSHRGDGYAESETMYTLNSTEHHAILFEPRSQDGIPRIHNDVSPTLNTAQGGQRQPCVMYAIQRSDEFVESEKTSTESARQYKDATDLVVAYGLDRAAYNQGKNAKFNFSIEKEKIGAQVAKGPGAVCQSVVRRLTPLECERLQGYPDHWTDIGEWVDSKGKKHKGTDSPRYKALGNSIALPFWQWMAERMVRYIPNQPTMASLFDGIGGFPLVFSRCGCEPVWASEIEEFPIAVAKKHFYN